MRKMKLTLSALSMVLAGAALAAEPKPGEIWCAVPESFSGDFAGAFYAHPDRTGEVWIINRKRGGLAAPSKLSSISQRGEGLYGFGFEGAISGVKPSPFVGGQVVFGLQVKASIPAGPSAGAPTTLDVALECAADEGALEALK